MIARLIDAADIGDEVRHFVFEACGVERLEFDSGQFVSISSQAGGAKVTRAYSIASPPGGNRFELCLNRVKEGRLSPWMFELQAGGEIDFQGPLGYFVLRRPPNDSVMVATGTGIAPFRSMLAAHLAAHPNRQFTLIFGVRHERTLLYRAEFEGLEAAHPNFRFWPTLSRPGSDWRGRSGYVQEHLNEAIGERRDVDVYVCGLKRMVDDVRSRLKHLGFDRKRIIFEKYD